MDVNVTATFEADQEWLERLHRAALIALDKTAEATHADLVLSGTMPFDTGALQNLSTTVNRQWLADGVVLISSSTPYARRLYYHPEYNFRRDKNPLAGGRWFDPYLPGYAKGTFIQTVFQLMLAQELAK